MNKLIVKLMLGCGLLMAGALAKATPAVWLLQSAQPSAEERAAAAWLQQAQPASRLLKVAELPSALPPTGAGRVLWWHAVGQPALDPALLAAPTVEAVRAFVQGGGGLLLSGFATQYVVPLRLERHAPSSVFYDAPPQGRPSGEWGLAPQAGSHPVFRGLPRPVRLLGAGLTVPNALSWWDDPASFSGRWLADNEGRVGKVALGEYRLGRGRVVVLGSGALAFGVMNQNPQRAQVETLMQNLFAYLGEAHAGEAPDPTLAAWWPLDEGHGALARDVAGYTSDTIVNNFGRPEWSQAAAAQSPWPALRLDGFSTWIERRGDAAPLLRHAFTLAAWVAPESYPVSFAAFINQYDGARGYSFGLNKFGQWGLRFKAAGLWQTAWAPAPLPLRRWSHAAVTFDRHAGVRLYLDGKLAAAQTALPGALEPAEGAPLFIGRDAQTGHVAEIFPTGALMAGLRDVRLYQRALGETEVAALAAAAGPPPAVGARLQVAADRFAADPHRPIYHALPPANWTNEPHGLVWHNGEYHLFYQANPTGPYWAHIQWGHLVSRDLLHWEDRPLALYPQPGIDQDGIWSGGAVSHGGQLHLLYTAVDGVRATVALASSTDTLQFTRSPHNPVIDGRPRGVSLMDYRDPYVWREGDVFYLLIGAGVPDVGGTALLYRSRDLITWEYLRPLFTGAKATSGVFFEMPYLVPLGGGLHLFYATEAPARMDYWLGRWENEHFTPLTPEPTRMDIFNHMLSPVPVTDQQGRLVALGITPETRSSREQLRAGWAHCFSLPRLWSLRPADSPTARPTLRQQPLPELAQLRGPGWMLENIALGEGSVAAMAPVRGDALELRATIEPGDAEMIEVHLRATPDAGTTGSEVTVLRFEPRAGQLTLDRTRSSLNPEVARDVQTGAFALEPGEAWDVHLFLDKSVVEGFLNERGTFSQRIYPTRADALGIDVRARGGAARLTRLEAWPMRGLRAEGSPAAP